MKQYSNNISILIDTSNNRKELVIDHKHIQNFHHTCVCYVNSKNEKKDDMTLQEEPSPDMSSTPFNFTNNLFISCEYIDTETVLKCTESVSPRVVVGSQSMLGNNPRQLFCGVIAYELLADGWINMNVTSSLDQGDNLLGTESNETEKVSDLVTGTPSHRKGTLNLDKDVDNVMSLSPAAVVLVGKIRVVF